MDYYDEELVGEGPCEFCGELYPLILLIEHQSTHITEANENYSFLDQGLNTTQQETITSELLPLLSEPTVLQFHSEETKEEKPCFSSNMKVSQSNINLTKQVQSSDNVEMKEFSSGNGEKILVYGSDMDQEQDLECVETFKVPNNPLLHDISENKDIEDINNLSDDDNSESLEEFWKRARDVLKQNRAKVSVQD